MASAVDLKCPECGARINAGPHQPVATCEYCGTRTQVQRREGFFQRPVPPPANVSFEIKNLPVATQLHTGRWVGLIILATVGLPLAIGGFAGYMACRQKRKVQERVARAQRKAQNRHRWYNHWAKPMVVDVTGDGVADIIGRILYFRKAPNTTYAAIDGKTGGRLWETPAYKSSDLSQSATAVVDGVWLLADSVGTLHAFNAKDGNKKWKIPMGERVDTICGAENGFALIKLKDKRVRKVNLSDGGVGDMSSDPPCRAVPSGERDAPPTGLRWATKGPRSGGKKVSQLPGMYASKVLERPSDGLLLALGNRRPGTRVPVIARYELNTDPDALKPPERPDRRSLSRSEYSQALREYSLKRREWYRRRNENQGKLLWKADVPGVHALKASTSTPEHVGVAQSVVVVPYKMRSSRAIRVAAFALSDGKRLWDVELPKKQSGSSSIEHTAVGKTRVFVSTDEHLIALSLADGKILFTVGQD